MRDTLSERIADAKAGWLPISGHVVNITVSIDERDKIVVALQQADSLEQLQALAADHRYSSEAIGIAFRNRFPQQTPGA